MAEYVIEKGIPVLPAVQVGQMSELRLTLRKMEVGDSISLYGKKEAATARGTRYRETQSSGKEFIIRPDTTVTDEGFYRIWRTA